MNSYEPTTPTIVFISGFFVLYLLLLTKRVVKRKIDLYDYFMLTTLGVIPFGFVMFPSLISLLARRIGVEFPFLVLFGALLTVSFYMVYRLIRRTNKLRHDVVVLVQQVGILRSQLDQQAEGANLFLRSHDERSVRVRQRV